MVIAYHAIFTTYGTWLPNDPRGSYSKQIYNEELQAFGEIKYGWQIPQPPHSFLSRFHTEAARKLSRPAVYLDAKRILLVSAGFSEVVARLDLRVLACAIMPNHVHMVICRGKYRVEYLVNQLKGAATQKLGFVHTPWTRKGWKVFLNNEGAVNACCRYVEANPVTVGLQPQTWPFCGPLVRDAKAVATDHR
jgi:REP element-mobilizing transposase RayT